MTNNIFTNTSYDNSSRVRKNSSLTKFYVVKVPKHGLSGNVVVRVGAMYSIEYASLNRN